MHFDGARWSRVALAPSDDRDLWSVGGGATGPVWIGGANGELVSLPP